MDSELRGLVLDANIVLSAVLGTRVLQVVRAFPQAAFHIPDVCLADAQTLLPLICAKRNLNAARFQRILTELEVILIPISRGLYEPHEDQALSRIRQRDPDGLAGSRGCAGARSADLDRGSRFLRLWNRDVDHQ